MSDKEGNRSGLEQSEHGPPDPKAAVTAKGLEGDELTNSQLSDATPRRVQTIESLHRDVALANQYRLELIKLVMTLATALLAFTVSFRPSLRAVNEPWLMWAGWIGLGVSILGGMVNMNGWDTFYISYRDYDWHSGPVDGKQTRVGITLGRRAGAFFQFAGFAGGVFAISFFAALNLANVAPPSGIK